MWTRTTTLAGVCVLLISVACAAPATGEDLQEAVPGDAVGYLELRDLGSLWQQFKGTPLAGDVKELLRVIGAWPEVEEGLAAFEEHVGTDLESLLIGTLGHRVGMCVHVGSDGVEGALLMVWTRFK